VLSNKRNILTTGLEFITRRSHVGLRCPHAASSHSSRCPTESGRPGCPKGFRREHGRCIGASPVSYVLLLQGGQTLENKPGKPGKVREFDTGQKQVSEITKSPEKVIEIMVCLFGATAVAIVTK